MKKAFINIYNKENVNYTLFYKYIFFEDNQPILFLCENNIGQLYICLLCDDRNALRYIISPTNLKLVSDMINNNITIFELFDLSEKLGFSWVVEVNNGKQSNQRVMISDVNKLDLPKENIKFDAEREEILDYYKEIYKDSLVKKRKLFLIM